MAMLWVLAIVGAVAAGTSLLALFVCRRRDPAWMDPEGQSCYPPYNSGRWRADKGYHDPVQDLREEDGIPW